MSEDRKRIFLFDGGGLALGVAFVLFGLVELNNAGLGLSFTGLGLLLLVIVWIDAAIHFARTAGRLPWNRFRLRWPLYLEPISPDDRAVGGVRGLVVRHSQAPPYRFKRPAYPYVHHRIGLQNPPGAEPASNVRLRLLDIVPRPRSGLFRHDFPYFVPPLASPNEFGRPLQIDPGSEELFEIAETWPRGGDEHQIVGGVDRKPEDLGTRPVTFPLEFDRDERWAMRYQATATGMQSTDFTVTVTEDNDGVRCQVSVP